MQFISMLFVLIIGLYFFMLIFIFYRNEKRRTKNRNVKRYTFEYCTKEMKKLAKYIYNSKDVLNDRGDILRDKQNEFFFILNIFDSLTVGIYTEVLNEEIVIMYFGSYMQSFYEDNRLNLFRMRKIQNNAGLYANYERFMEELDFRKKRLKNLNSRRVK